MEPPGSQPTDEAGSVPILANALEPQKAESRAFLGAARRNLSEDELSSNVTRRFLLDDLERLDRECERLRLSESDYVELRIKFAAQSEALKASRWKEVLSFTCSTVGAAALGAAPSYVTTHGFVALGIVIVVGAVILLAVGVASKVFS